MRKTLFAALALAVFVAGAYAERAVNSCKSTRLSSVAVLVSCQDEREPRVSKIEETATAIVVTCQADPHNVSALPASWDGHRFSCPAGLNLWADENEALAGKDYAYCVR